MTNETQTRLGKGPYRVNDRIARVVVDADGIAIGRAFPEFANEKYDCQAVARLFASSWSFYQAAKLRAEYLRMNERLEAKLDGEVSAEHEQAIDAINAGLRKCLELEANAMALVEGRAATSQED